MAKKKFDTNPLDPEFPEKVKEAQTTALPQNTYETSELTPPSVTEEQTRRFNEANFTAYQSPFNGQQVPASYKTTNIHAKSENISRKVDKIGLPENILTAAPYIPFTLGLIAGLIMLFIVPKSEPKVRFHAAQGLAAHIAILIITTILSGFDNFIPFADTANRIFWLITTIMLIIFTVKAWQGKPVHIESVDDLTNWLEDKIKPKN